MTHRSFTIKDKQEWNAYIMRATEFETYQTWCYHSLNKEGEQVLFVYEEGNRFIVLPLIKRKIENSTFYDLTSVYGYSGPLSNFSFDEITLSTKINFYSSFKSFMSREQCVSVFSRLHPFINQHFILDDIGVIKGNGSTIYMDLTNTLNDQVMKYEKRLYRQIKSIRKKGYLIKEASGEDEVRAFAEMYNENMDRLNAASHYYYDHNYFLELISIQNVNNKLILIYDGSELICGALILLSKNIIRNHLSATSARYLKESPSKLLTDEISMIGRKLGMRTFHLGGGVGGKEDSLFRFKRYFSDQLLPDHIWCYIHNLEIYNDLVINRQHEIDLSSNFFPLYRQNLKNSKTKISTSVMKQLQQIDKNYD